LDSGAKEYIIFDSWSWSWSKADTWNDAKHS